jgi:hypothetical protein
MIYLLTHPTTKHNVLIVKTTSDLPFNHNQTLSSSNIINYMIDNKVFADVSIIPNHLEGTEEEIQSIAKNYFSDYIVKKFDSVDFFSAYLIYTMSN